MPTSERIAIWVLVEAGLLVTYAGQYWLHKVLASLDSHRIPPETRFFILALAPGQQFYFTFRGTLTVRYQFSKSIVQ